jgi:pilus assembly protein FimV
VSISFEAGTGTSEGRLRVRSASVVDEPVVTLYVRVGCSAKVTRRYVLLADYPSETAAPIRTSEVLALPQALVSASPPVQPPPAATPLRPTTETQPKSVVRLPKSVPAQSSVVAEVDAGAPKAEGESARRALRPESVVRRKVTAPAGRARLKLEPLDLLVERDPTLRPSSELLTPVAENAQARAQAQALWRAINARPEEVLRDQQKLQSLEGEAKALRDSNTKAQANIVLLKDQLAKAERRAVCELAGLSAGDAGDRRHRRQLLMPGTGCAKVAAGQDGLVEIWMKLLPNRKTRGRLEPNAPTPMSRLWPKMN